MNSKKIVLTCFKYYFIALQGISSALSARQKINSFRPTQFLCKFFSTIKYRNTAIYLIWSNWISLHFQKYHSMSSYWDIGRWKCITKQIYKQFSMWWDDREILDAAFIRWTRIQFPLKLLHLVFISQAGPIDWATCVELSDDIYGNPGKII